MHKNITVITMDELNMERLVENLIIPHPFKNEDNIKLRIIFMPRGIYFLLLEEEKLHKNIEKRI